MTRPVHPGSRYGRDEDGRRQPRGAGPRPPGLAGGTYKSRELGIDNLKDVPMRFSDIPRGSAQSTGMSPFAAGADRGGA